MMDLDSIRALPAERVEVSKLLTADQTVEREGKFLERSQIPTIIKGENVDVFCKETGKCLLKLRTNVTPPDVVVAGYNALHEAGERTSYNRGMAAGEHSDEVLMKENANGRGIVRLSGYRYKRILADGTVSGTSYAKETNGSIVGYFGSDPRFPYCRLTAYTQENFQKFQAAFPMIRSVDDVYQALMPEPYQKQRAVVDASSSDFVVEGTAFSTVTVNKNFRTACHYDQGDFREGFGNLAVVRRGRFEGSETCFPQYGIGVDVQTCDVLLMDVHQLHGNLPFKPLEPKATRLALVMYFREDIQECGTQEEELKKARDVNETRARRPGSNRASNRK